MTVGLAVGVGVAVEVAEAVAVAVAVAVIVGVGVNVAVAVGVGEKDCAQYLAPVSNSIKGLSANPPHTIISPPVHTAVCTARASGALVVLVAVQLSVAGLYLPPVLKNVNEGSVPPQMTISLPVHTAV